MLTGDVVTSDCLVGQPQRFRELFEPVPADEPEYWELKEEFRLTSPTDQRGEPRASLGFANGNYNYRHQSIALNVVGTGVLDCRGQTSACYGDGVLQYELEHVARDVPVESHGGQRTCFDFGAGAIRGGKALATERYISVPLSGPDAALLEQPGVTQEVFGGRPLAGRYRLRIRAEPQLDWERVEDIQLVVTSRHWSRVTQAREE